VTAAAGAFCAICGDDIVGNPRREPLGKDEALVNVCDDCATEPAREVRGPDRGYQARVGVPLTEVKRKASNYLRSVGAPRRGLYRSLASRPSLGYVVVRVPRLLLGKSIDLAEAQETLRDQPWFADLRVLGSTPKWHLFERPDRDLVAKSRRELNGADPLAAMEKWSQK
jgi:hypothetical protein